MIWYGMVWYGMIGSDRICANRQLEQSLATLQQVPFERAKGAPDVCHAGIPPQDDAQP